MIGIQFRGLTSKKLTAPQSNESYFNVTIAVGNIEQQRISAGRCTGEDFLAVARDQVGGERDAIERGITHSPLKISRARTHRRTARREYRTRRHQNRRSNDHQHGDHDKAALMTR